MPPTCLLLGEERPNRRGNMSLIYCKNMAVLLWLGVSAVPLGPGWSLQGSPSFHRCLREYKRAHRRLGAEKRTYAA
jgi:hypothetical protein